MSSASPRPVQTMYGYERGVYAAYDYADGRVDYEKTVYRLSRLGSRALTVLGEVHLQEASDSLDNQSDYLDKANDAFSERIFSHDLGFDPKAATRFAQMSLFKAIIIDKVIPKSDDLADSYSAVLWTAVTAANHFTFRDDQSSREGRELLGNITEETVLSIATRKTLQDHDNLIPVQSLLKQDLPTGNHERGWDMSIYGLSGDGKLEIKNKVQIKNSRQHVKKYNRDIAVVSVNPDLAISKETHIGSIEILADLQKEVNPFTTSHRATKRLNHRSDKLFRIIDRSK